MMFKRFGLREDGAPAPLAPIALADLNLAVRFIPYSWEHIFELKAVGARRDEK